MPATSPTQSAPTWPVVKRSWRMMTISEPFRILFLTRLRKTSSSHRGKTWLRSRKRGGVLWMLSLSSSSSSDFANDAVGPPLSPPAGADPQAAAGRRIIHQHRSRIRRRRRSRLIWAPSIAAGPLNPVRMRSKAGSVRRQCESPNEVISPPEKNVPLMFPHVIGRSRCERES